MRNSEAIGSLELKRETPAQVSVRVENMHTGDVVEIVFNDDTILELEECLAMMRAGKMAAANIDVNKLGASI